MKKKGEREKNKTQQTNNKTTQNHRKWQILILDFKSAFKIIPKNLANKQTKPQKNTGSLIFESELF